MRGLDSTSKVVPTSKKFRWECVGERYPGSFDSFGSGCKLECHESQVYILYVYKSKLNLMCMLHEDEWAYMRFCSYLLSEFQSKMSVFPFSDQQTAYMPNNPTSRFPSWDYPIIPTPAPVDSILFSFPRQLHRLTQGIVPWKSWENSHQLPPLGCTDTRSFPARRSVEISPAGSWNTFFWVAGSSSSFSQCSAFVNYAWLDWPSGKGAQDGTS